MASSLQRISSPPSLESIAAWSYVKNHENDPPYIEESSQYKCLRIFRKCVPAFYLSAETFRTKLSSNWIKDDNFTDEIYLDLIKNAFIKEKFTDSHAKMLFFTSVAKGFISTMQELRLLFDSSLADIYSPALFLAAEHGHLEIVEELIKADADVNQKLRDDLTPLIIAGIKGHKEIEKKLILAGASSIDLNANSEEAIDLFFKHNFPDDPSEADNLKGLAKQTNFSLFKIKNKKK
ncbi:MAG: hypothetical protein K1060chlam1_01487 [Candidatus Anoxychlamydiales bacterium]|nr:hypothetical protein [Candidatus Anoxychlamydiales bacterium]